MGRLITRGSIVLGIIWLTAGMGSAFDQPRHFSQPELITFEGRCIKTPEAPKLGKIGNEPAVASKNDAKTFNYAIVEVEIVDFDPANPVEIRIYDDTHTTSNQPLETVKFHPHKKAPCPPLKTLRVPVFLAHDPDPWSRVDKEPEERTTRIEVHHAALEQSLTAYAKLVKGTFVVPVYWHNTADAGDRSYVDPLHVMELFWTAPTGLHHNDLNSIWAEANVQFRLLNTGIPFHVGSIPAHIIKPPEHSPASSLCQVGWSQNYNSTKGVDVYTVYNLSGGDPAGIGNCRAEGFVLLKAHNPNSQPDAGFTDPMWNAEARAVLVAHEFGHYLAALPHKDISNNLMHSMLGGWDLDQSQIGLARQRIKDFGNFNETR